MKYLARYLEVIAAILFLSWAMRQGDSVPAQLQYEACVEAAADLGFTTGATKKRCWAGAFDLT